LTVAARVEFGSDKLADELREFGVDALGDERGELRLAQDHRGRVASRTPWALQGDPARLEARQRRPSIEMTVKVMAESARRRASNRRRGASRPGNDRPAQPCATRVPPMPSLP
jgi:hypothetical protein